MKNVNNVVIDGTLNINENPEILESDANIKYKELYG